MLWITVLFKFYSAATVK
ncbi:hypothetical protein SOVF_103170, partial [Spinacia oleracea]